MVDFLLVNCLFFLSSWLLTPELARADDLGPPPESSFSIGAGYDSDKNQDYRFLLDVEFSNFQRLTIFYSQIENSIDDFSTRYYSLSTATSIYETISLEAAFDYAKSNKSFESNQLSGTVNFSATNWNISVSPQLSATTFYLNLNRINNFDVVAKGILLSASYFGFEQTYFSVSLFKNSFFKKSSFLRNAVSNALNTNATRSEFINNQVKTLGSNLADEQFSLTFGRYVSWGGSLDLTWIYTTLFNTANWLGIDSLEDYDKKHYANSIYGSSSFSINKNFTLNILMGWQTIFYLENKLYFSSVELNYRW